MTTPPHLSTTEEYPLEEDFWDFLERLVASSRPVVDRPKGSRHPRLPCFGLSTRLRLPGGHTGHGRRRGRFLAGSLAVTNEFSMRAVYLPRQGA
jgi:hypothetical protein